MPTQDSEKWPLSASLIFPRFCDVRCIGPDALIFVGWCEGRVSLPRAGCVLARVRGRCEFGPNKKAADMTRPRVMCIDVVEGCCLAG